MCDNLRGLSTAKSYYHINSTFSLLPPVHRRLNSEATMFYLSVAVVLGRWIFCQLICYKLSSRNQGINWLRVVVVKWLSLSFQQLFRAQLIRMEHTQKDQLCHVTAIFCVFSSFNSRKTFFYFAKPSRMKRGGVVLAKFIFFALFMDQLKRKAITLSLKISSTSQSFINSLLFFFLYKRASIFGKRKYKEKHLKQRNNKAYKAFTHYGESNEFFLEFSLELNSCYEHAN